MYFGKCDERNSIQVTDLDDRGYGLIDSLDYTYFNDGRLHQVTELDNKTLGFKSLAANGIAQYQYDANGNMTSDDHKEIGVTYNYLNLPVRVNKEGEGFIVWTYDAMGIKLSKQVITDSLFLDQDPIPNDEYEAAWVTSIGKVAPNSEVQFTAENSIYLRPGFKSSHHFKAEIEKSNVGQVREYCDGLEYYEGELEAVYHEAGRVSFNETNISYEYIIADHLLLLGYKLLKGKKDYDQRY